MNFFAVAMGGAVGAVLRYLISSIPVKTTFPILTLIINIIGAVAIGFIVGAALEKEEVSDYLILFLKTGVCGGFTTFSTFSLEAYGLFENRALFQGGLYIFLSISMCLLGIWFGRKMAVIIR